MRVVSIQSEALPKNIRPLSVLLGTILAAVLLVPMAPAEPPTTTTKPGDVVSDNDNRKKAGRVNVMIAAQQGTIMPRRIEGSDPQYTSLAHSEGTTGSVKLEVTVDSNGMVQHVQLDQGLPHGLSDAAIRAARGWRFEPARRFGEPVEITMRVAIAFDLFDSAPQNLNAILVSEIEPLLPAGTTLTSLTTEGALLRLEGIVAGPEETTKLLERIENSTSFSQPFLESMTPAEGGFQFQMTCERAD